MTEAEAAARAVTLLTYNGTVCHLFRDPREWGRDPAWHDDERCVLCGKTFGDMRMEPPEVSVFEAGEPTNLWCSVKVWCDGSKRERPPPEVLKPTT